MKLLGLGLCLLFTFSATYAAVRTEATLPAGTTISVKLSDGIDSDRDPFDKQYAASIASPVVLADGQTIAAGSPATVVLLHNNSGWLPQLTTVTINDRRFKVTSGAGTLVGPAQSRNPGNKPDSTLATLKEMGGAAPTITASTPLPSGPRVRLPAATELRFVLIETAAPARVISAASRHTIPSRARAAVSAPQVERETEPGVPYLCRANDTPDRGVPISYYVADVFETSDSPAEVEKRWFDFLVTTYPYRFAHSSRAVAKCTRLQPDTYAQQDMRNRLEQEWKAENAQVIQTRWHYRIGPPPPAATLPPASTLP